MISSTVKVLLVVDPSIDQRVVIRGGRPTLQPLTTQQRWERGTAKWLVLLHSQRLEREAAKSSRYRQLRDMGGGAYPQAPTLPLVRPMGVVSTGVETPRKRKRSALPSVPLGHPSV